MQAALLITWRRAGEQEERRRLGEEERRGGEEESRGGGEQESRRAGEQERRSNQSSHLGIHKPTNACWSIPRSQTVFYHFKFCRKLDL